MLANNGGGRKQLGCTPKFFLGLWGGRFYGDNIGK
jgi:hypothetical protein